jgi:hypothetical protein
MSANRLRAGLLKGAAHELDRRLHALTSGEAFRAASIVAITSCRSTFWIE